ncbi:hypothetical protein Tco_0116911 [Tanacetum coccineum]
MSSPNRSTSDIEDTFSFMNILNYTSVSSDYFPASSGSSSFNSLENSTDNMIPPVFSSFYNNPCLKDNQTCVIWYHNLSVSTSTPPQVFEVGKSHDKMYLKHHEKQVEDILNYLDELHLHRIERNDAPYITQVFALSKVSNLHKVGSFDLEAEAKDTATGAPAISLAFQKQKTSVHISSGLALQRHMASSDNTSGPVPQRKERSGSCCCSRVVDPAGSPSSTTIDQDVPSASTSLTNQEIQSQVTHQGVEEQIHRHQNAQFDKAPLYNNLSSDPSSEETTL